MLRRTTVLALIALVFVMVSPVWGGGSASTRAAASTGFRDLKGLHVINGSWNTDYNVLTATPPTSELGLKIYNWRLQVFREHNFTMEDKRIAANNGESLQLMISSIMAGDPAATTFTQLPDQVISLMGQGLIFPITDNRVVNLRNPQPVREGVRAVEWSQTTLDAFALDGKSYAYSLGTSVSNVDLIFFNKRHFIEAGVDPDLPYNMQRDGTWTWDNFLDLCRRLTRDINNDGIIDRYAFTRGNATLLTSAIVTSNGAQLLDRDPRTGRFINSTNTPAFIEALQFIQRLQAAGVMSERPTGVPWDWERTAFMNGELTMLFAESYFQGTFTSMADDWGIVLAPRGPRSNSVRVPLRDGPRMVPVTFNLDQVDDIMYALALYNTPQDQPDDWRIASYPTYRDFRAVDETINLIRNRPDLHLYKYWSMAEATLPMGDIIDRIWEVGANPATIVESASPRYNGAIDDLNRALGLR